MTNILLKTKITFKMRAKSKQDTFNRMVLELFIIVGHKEMEACDVGASNTIFGNLILIRENSDSKVVKAYRHGLESYSYFRVVLF